MNVVAVGELHINESSCSELALLDDILENDTHFIDPEAESKLEALELVKSGINKEISKAQEKIIRVNNKLLVDNNDLVAILQKLQDECMETQATIVKESMKKQGRDPEEEERLRIESEEKADERAREEAEKASREEEAAWKPSSERVSKKVKRLFREIASKTHPDKTRNDSPSVREAKSKLFIAAMKARDANDYDGLCLISAQLKGMGSSLLSKIIDRLKLVESEVKSLKLELAQVKASTPYALAVDYESDNPWAKGGVTARYRSMLNRYIAEAKSQLAELKRMQGVAEL